MKMVVKKPLFRHLLLLGLLCVTAQAYAAAPEPLAVKNRFPLHLIFLTPRPTAAALPPVHTLSARVAVDYSADYFDHSNARWDFLMDMETTVTDISLSYVAAPGWAIALDAPVLSMNSGFLDGFLQSYHNALGVGNYGRENRPSDSFAYHARKDGQVWIEGESGLYQFTDVTLSVQKQLGRSSRTSGFSSALLGSVKLPTGDAYSGYGSGRWDAGLFFPMQWVLRSWSFFLMPGAAVINDPETRGAAVSARNSYSLFGGLGYAYNEKWSWMVQATYYTSPIETTGLSVLDDGALELVLGGRYTMSRHWAVAFAFCEDLTRSAPDFTLHLGFVWRSDFQPER